jgi:hypothetical protein
MSKTTQFKCGTREHASIFGHELSMLASELSQRPQYHLKVFCIPDIGVREGSALGIRNLDQLDSNHNIAKCICQFIHFFFWLHNMYRKKRVSLNNNFFNQGLGRLSEVPNADF